MMTHEETQALGRVIDHYIHDECKHAGGTGDTTGHIAEALVTLEKFRERQTSELIGEAPPIEEVASRPNGEASQPEAQDDFDKVQWQILYCLLQSANLPDEIKMFVDEALKVKDANLLRAALRALDSYAMPEIPF